jgi:ribonuclease HII
MKERKRGKRPVDRGLELLEHDLELGRRAGVTLIAGCDEAGRGSLAGPLVAAAVCLDLDCLEELKAQLRLLDDSKRLRPELREQLYDAVLGCAVKTEIKIVSAEEIDRQGLHRSNLKALDQALRGVTPPAQLQLSDHYRVGLAQPLTKGDSKSAAIAAAAILAKVSRDRLMREYHELYPGYGFQQNVGYSTAAHKDAVRRLGPTPLHRLSFDSSCYQPA